MRFSRRSFIMGYFHVHEIFESKIHAELKQSRKQHDRPPPLPNFFSLFNTVTFEN